jgi:NADP-dependent 3-hydroxy acid dehydrogenase YdfG
MNLQNRVVVITGASSGIGQAAAKELAQDKTRLLLAARRVDRLEQLAGEVEALGAEALVKETDVTSRGACEAAVQAAADKWGGVDVLINNAGIMPLSYLDKLKMDEWEQMVDVNIKGVMYMTAAALPYLIDSGHGFIVNISSVAGRRVYPGGAVYCGTKAFVCSFSEGLRQELSAEKNLRVVAIEPGVVATELTQTITDDDIRENMKPIFQDIEPLQSEDIARTIGYVIRQPEHMSVNEVLIRPTQQPM